MSVTHLQQQIKEREDKIARVQQSKTRFEQQFAALNAEEQSLIVSARTGDEAAKTRLAQVRQDKKTTEREIRDDASAIAEITRELDQLRAALAEEQGAATRQKLLREVAKFSKRAEENRGRIAAAAAELRNIGETCSAEADALRKLLVELDEDIAVNSVVLGAIELRHGLTQAADILVAKRSGDALYVMDSVTQMQRFIAALEAVARDIEHASEPVSA